MAASDKLKQSLYFSEDVLEEMKHEAVRQDRPLSWIAQQAWRIARDELAMYPSTRDIVARAVARKGGGG